MKSKQNVIIFPIIFVVITLSIIAAGIYLFSPAKEVARDAEDSTAFVDESDNDQAAEIPGSCSSLGQLIKESTQPGPPKADLDSCCPGLIPTFPLEDFNKNCANTYLESGPTGATNYLCLACGDGVCDGKYENKCNCSEDCN